jgi:hypothetical protein
MKILAALILSLASSFAMAADYTVGIVNNTGGNASGGTAVNLYRTTTREGIEVVQTYVLQQTNIYGSLVRPLTLAVNPAHTFVYIVYTSPVYNIPNIFGFKITPKGLELQWEQPISTGDYAMQGGYLVAGPNYVIENLFPAGAWIYVLNQKGEQMLQEVGESDNFISSSIDSTETFYYSCRGSIPSSFVESVAPLPITSVSVYRIERESMILVNETAPVVTSTDPAYIQSVCAP